MASPYSEANPAPLIPIEDPALAETMEAHGSKLIAQVRDGDEAGALDLDVYTTLNVGGSPLVVIRRVTIEGISIVDWYALSLAEANILGRLGDQVLSYRKAHGKKGDAGNE